MQPDRYNDEDVKNLIAQSFQMGVEYARRKFLAEQERPDAERRHVSMPATGIDSLFQAGVLDLRTHNLLRKFGIEYLSDLSDYRSTEILQIRGMGAKCYEKLHSLMDKYAIRFKDQN